MPDRRRRDPLPPAPRSKSKKPSSKPARANQGFTPLQWALALGGFVAVGLVVTLLVVVASRFSKPVPPPQPGDALAPAAVAWKSPELQGALLSLLKADDQGQVQRSDNLELQAPDRKTPYRVDFRYNAIDNDYEVQGRGSVVAKKGLDGFAYVTPNKEVCYLEYDRITFVVNAESFRGGSFTVSVVDRFTRQQHDVQLKQLPVEDEKAPGVLALVPAKPNDTRPYGKYYHVSRVRKLVGDHPPLDPSFPQTLEGLTAKLDSPDFYERMLSLAELGKLGKDAAPAAEKVAALLSNPYFRPYALKTLADTQAPPEITLKIFLPMLQPQVSSGERKLALVGLKELGPAAVQAIPELLALLHANVDREQTLAIFTAIGPAGVEPLMARLHAASLNALTGQLDAQVLFALGAIGEPSIDPLLRLLDQALPAMSKRPIPLRLPIEPLAYLAQRSPRAVEPIVALLRKHDQVWVRMNNDKVNQIHQFAKQVGSAGAVILAGELANDQTFSRFWR